MRRSWMILVCFLLGAVLLRLYFSMRLPEGVESKGGAESILPWVSLAGALVSLLTGVATLWLKLLELRLKQSETRVKGH